MGCFPPARNLEAQDLCPKAQEASAEQQERRWLWHNRRSGGPRTRRIRIEVNVGVREGAWAYKHQVVGSINRPPTGQQYGLLVAVPIAWKVVPFPVKRSMFQPVISPLASVE